MTSRQRQDRQTATYRELIGIAEEVVESARMVLRQTRKARSKDMTTDMVIRRRAKRSRYFVILETV